ncbi:MAG: YecA family protein [Opitutae bacterium]|nr:YecA family protein [Opitutae bacterium]
MTRHEAYVEKGWEEMGLAHLFVSRIREDGSADFAMFLVDLLCLGVKDAAFEADVGEIYLKELVKERLPEDYRERILPACAKKLIEGAVAYAEKLGFTPHRDFRKARKVLNGIDASVCPREFAYGRDGRPCYVRGADDSDERVDRICAILEARCGADGFDYEDPGETDDEDPVVIREDLMEWLDAEPESVPRFYQASGLITAMLICPTVLSPLKMLDVLWGKSGRVWEHEDEAREFTDLLMLYWNLVDAVVQNALAPNAPPGERIFDIWEQDFEDDEEHGGLAMSVATMEWARGFMLATEVWPEAWGDTLTRPELAPYWAAVNWWADFARKENRDQMIAHAESSPPHTLNQSLIALARALRPPASWHGSPDP